MSYDSADYANRVAWFCDRRWWFYRFDGLGLVDTLFLWRGTLRIGLCIRTSRTGWGTRCGQGWMRMAKHAVDDGCAIVD